jgi:hypothetical protein
VIEILRARSDCRLNDGLSMLGTEGRQFFSSGSAETFDRKSLYCVSRA